MSAARGTTRRTFLKQGTAAGLALGAAPLAACNDSSPPRPPRREQVAIVGAGLAGLTCAYRLHQAGIEAAVFEARPDRLGGRCFTARAFADGQVGEHGGEFIDTNHRAIQALVDELGLELEDREAAVRELPPTRGARLFDGELRTAPEIYRGYGAMLGRLNADRATDRLLRRLRQPRRASLRRNDGARGPRHGRTGGPRIAARPVHVGLSHRRVRP